MLKNKEFLKNTLNDVAGFFFKNKFHTKKYYHPNNIETIKHTINLPVSYYDLYKKSSKKLRLILKGIDDPVFLNIYCRKEYPIVTRQYIDDCDQEHEIIINMKIDNTISNLCNDYNHIVNDDGRIDLIKHIHITWLEYLIGCRKSIEYIDSGILEIVINPFNLKNIVI